MAGNQLTINKQVKASTILEVIISMVIILVVFTMAMMIYANVQRSSLSVKKIKAEALLQEILTKAEQNKENTTQTFTIDDLKVEQTIKSYQGNMALTEIDLAAYDMNQDTVAKLQKVMLNKNE